jgi:hypothetical protein
VQQWAARTVLGASGEVGEMATVTYILGTVDDLEQLYPPAHFANGDLGFRDYTDVIAHYTNNSLLVDGFEGASVSVRILDGHYEVSIEVAATDGQALDSFAARHVELFGPGAGMKALRGKELLEQLGVWNPMADYPVNKSPSDGKSKWNIYPPLGLSIIGQRAVLVMHYPPWQVLQQAIFSNSMTWARWSRVLVASGVPPERAISYQTIVDVNPIAAPGSGESEYPNDYFPIMMASGFFDGGPDRDYIRSMLELYLNPPGHDHSKYTLPLLICGSPLYDPQAPGWLRVAYKDQLPVDANGSPTVDVMQAGTLKIRPDSKRETPYMVANHMIAAGVTGACTNDPSKMPDIRLYEAQDLVAATFLQLLSDNPDLGAAEAKAQACTRWFGNPAGTGAPMPASDDDRLIICALAQVDLFFEPLPGPHPKYTYDEAMERCRNAHDKGNPCCGSIAPPPDVSAT